MANPTNAAEVAMAQALAGINMNPLSEVQNAWRDITTGSLSPADAKVAQGYMYGLMAAGPPSDVTTTSGAGLSGTPGSPTTATSVGNPSLLDLMSPETRKWMETGKTGGPIDKVDVTTTATDWLKARSSDLAVIVLGVVIVAVALFASSTTKELVVKAGAKGFGA